jgi:peroxiredoxin
MAETASNMMPLGTKAPEFSLPNVLNEEKLSLADVRGEQGLVVMFICAHCPYVKHIQEELAFVAEKYQHRGLGFVAISSNDVGTHPEDAPDQLKIQAEDNDFTFPYLYDETQEVARSYDAACTPDFYLFDADLKCVYRGRFDSSTPGNDEPVNGEDLRTAMDAMLDGEAVLEDQKPSLGCNIKWK